MRWRDRARLGDGVLPQKLSSSAVASPVCESVRADHAELVRVNAKFCFQLKAVLKRRARILELEHLRLFRSR